MYTRRRELLFDDDGKIFTFNKDLATFTAGMAKRNSAGPFGAGVMVQGLSDGSGADVLSLPRGTQINANWYANFDPYQGTFVNWWTPEYSSGAFATNYHYFFYVSATYYFCYDYTNAWYRMVIGNQTLTVASAVVAGTTLNIAISWDVDNTIDGTNYVRMSINDVHTYGVTSAPTIAAPSATMYIGSNGSIGAVSAVLEGTCVLRRPLWDGAYGADVGNGDEVNLIYAAGAGKDPTEITGSWDVCLCVPTDAVAGALVTG